jgi:hypothetical protein
MLGVESEMKFGLWAGAAAAAIAVAPPSGASSRRLLGRLDLPAAAWYVEAAKAAGISPTTFHGPFLGAGRRMARPYDWRFDSGGDDLGG